mgnify:CR=1 FL=1
MRLARAILTLILLSLATAGQLSADAGHLVIIGGGSRPPHMIQKIVELAGGEEARLLIIPVASIEPVETAEYQKGQFEEAGAGSVDYIIFDRETVDSEENLAALAQATGVFLSGGDQRRLTETMMGSRLLERLHELYTNGGVIAGTSAGAAVMSPVMITGDERINQDPERAFETIQRGNMDTRAGFDLLPGTIVDQHFVIRRRHNRLISLVLEHPKLLGIGIDESTAIIVGPPDRFEVLGESLVLVYDASQARGITTDKGGNLAGAGVSLHVLSSGQRFDLETRAPIP